MTIVEEKDALIREFQLRRHFWIQVKPFVIAVWALGMGYLFWVAVSYPAPIKPEDRLLGLPIMAHVLFALVLIALSGIVSLYALSGILCPHCGEIPRQRRYIRIMGKQIHFLRGRVQTNPEICPNCGIRLKAVEHSST